MLALAESTYLLDVPAGAGVGGLLSMFGHSRVKTGNCQFTAVLTVSTCNS